MPKILVVDDHRMFLDGVQSILEKDSSLSVSCVVDAAQALEKLNEECFDLVLIDIEMPKSALNGVELTIRLSRDYSELPILIVSMNKSAQTVDDLIKAGASGYIIKDSGRQTLQDAIKALLTGGEFWDPEILQLLIAQKKNDILASNKEVIASIQIELTSREKDVLKWLALGLSSKQIAEKLFIGTSTVDTHRKNMIAKFSAQNSTEVVMKAKEMGLI